MTNTIIPYLVRLAEQGVVRALGADPGFAAGLKTFAGQLANEAVARDQGREFVAPYAALRLGAGVG